MAHRIDTSFRKAKHEARLRRARRRAARRAVFLALFLIAAGGGFFVWTLDRWSFDALDENLVAVDSNIEADASFADDQDAEEGAPASADLEPAYVPPNVDLAGDPLLISIGSEAGPASRVSGVSRPETLQDTIVAPTLSFLSDRMVSSSERFMTTLPSSQEDFALFQAQRSIPTSVGPSDEEIAALAATLAEQHPQDAELDDGSGGWGEALDGSADALPEFERPRVENTTSIALMLPEARRFRGTEDVFVRVLEDRDLRNLFVDNGLSAEAATAAAEAGAGVFGIERLEKGSVVALRLRREAKGGSRDIFQASVYRGEQYLGTLVRTDEGELTAGADPWVRDDLFSYVDAQDTVRDDRRYRLLDAIYSTAVRNAVPTGIVGEAIQMLSRSNDLNAFAQVDDRLVLLYSEEGRHAGGGRVLYVGIVGPDREMHCYVFGQEDGSYACGEAFSEEQEVVVVNGMVTPVKGVLTSRFGPRTHPVHKTVRMHKGVDWAAPTGTPIVAAFDGVVSFAGVAGGYGNMVRLAHSEGRETRYAHMSRFAPKTRTGVPVKAGEVIGYVGTTGLSTGPHLHFELRRNAQAIDPLGGPVVASVGAATAYVPQGVTTGGRAIDKFIDAIIRIESGGNPRAKNPLSTASGLGQFINSTWMRMIRTYRPGLLKRMSRQQILNLRFEPNIAREMLYHLTRETEVFLRRRGHTVTPGRLYLGHFLGPGDANRILRTPGGVPLHNVLSGGVMRANPFLRGWNVAKIQNWAERKMAGRRGRKRIPRVAVNTQAPAQAPVRRETRTIRRENKKFVAYKNAIEALLKEQATGA